VGGLNKKRKNTGRIRAPRGREGLGDARSPGKDFQNAEEGLSPRKKRSTSTIRDQWLKVTGKIARGGLNFL